MRDACSKVYDWVFEVSLHLFSAFKMTNELPITVDMFRHNTSYGRSLLSLLSAGPPTRNPSGLEKGCVGKEGKGKGIALWSHPIFLACASCGQEVSASHLCFPSRALEQDEAIKAGCQRIVTVSLLCKLHAQMLLFSALGLADSHS